MSLSHQNLRSMILYPALAGLFIGALILVFNYSDTHIGPLGKPEPASYKLAVNQAAPAVVSIYANKPRSQNDELYKDPMFRLYYKLGLISRQVTENTVLGSGMIISPQGYIATNGHVVTGATDLLVVLADGREARAHVVGIDQVTDVAVLKVALDKLPYININQSREPSVGDIVLAIGNPYGVGLTVTQGIISATERVYNSRQTSYIQTDAAINPGNSGGPIIDSTGALLGMSTSVLNNTTTEGISFAIPTNTIRFVTEQLVKHGHVNRGWIGISGSVLSPQQSSMLKLPVQKAFAITDVSPDSPALDAGLHRGDIIIGWEDKPFGSQQNLIQNVVRTEPGSHIALSVWRNRQQQTIRVTIGQQN